mgnify:FL=1
MKRPLSDILNGGNYYGFEVNLYNDDQMVFKGTVLTKQKGELSLKDTFDHTTFKHASAKKLKAAVVINTNKVLTKCLENQSLQNDMLVEKAFPNLDRNLFYVQICHEKDLQLVSIARKKHVHDCIAPLESLGIYTTSIILGNVLVFGLKQLSDLEHVYTSNAEVNLVHSKIQKLEDLPNKTYEIQDQRIESIYLLSFLAGIHQHIRIIDVDHNFQNIIESSNQEYHQMLLFFYGLRGAIVLLLTGLLINFIYFNKYYSYIQQQENTDNSKLQSILTPLKTQVDRLDKLTVQILENKGSSSSFFVNEIIKTLPDSVRLYELSFQPLSKPIRKDKPVELEENTIHLSGNSYSKEDFAFWNTQLQDLEWVSQILIKKFDAIGPSSHVFEITIVVEI